MNMKEPVVELQPQFSSGGAIPTPWAEARERLEKAKVYWLTTVRPDGRPHVTPLVTLWLKGALYFCTGPGERRAKNLAGNTHCVVTTGCNVLSEGLDWWLKVTRRARRSARPAGDSRSRSVVNVL